MEYEDRLRISTPEGVELELTLAGIGSRFTASLIDHAIQAALVIASIALFAQVGDAERAGVQVGADAGASDALGVAIITVWSFLVFLAYDILFEVRGGGRTPGKRLTGLRVVRTSGRPVGFVTSAIRNVLRAIDILPAFYGVAFATMFGTAKNQRLGDIAAGTIVVRERTGGRGRKAPAVDAEAGASEPAPRGDVAEWDVSAVSAEDVATVRRFLERRAQLTSEARRSLARDLAGRLRPKVAGAPADLDPEAFLRAVSDAKAARAG